MRYFVSDLFGGQNQKSVCDYSRRNETKDRVELGQLLYEVYPMLDALAHNRSI
ncbi:hypothetical protein HYC85_012252 [Camellia sinensis]|uniref:Uncharacterized protein n=1 Tax=Camellia sinensis TaxID=4442 RepID=A0A7J7HC16_CAMSI|nr:hypothetical protein HYC85_012252 [Camellia sinensis]